MTGEPAVERIIQRRHRPRRYCQIDLRLCSQRVPSADMPPRTRRTPLESDERSSDSPSPVPDQRRHHRGRNPSTPSTRYTQPDPYYDQRYADRYWTYGQDGQPQYPIHDDPYRPDGYPPDIPWSQPLPQTRISDTTLFLAVLFGASIGNITVGQADVLRTHHSQFLDTR